MIIALVILGGGMFFFYGRVTIVREAHRRAAVLVASQRLEELKATKWNLILDKYPPGGTVTENLPDEYDLPDGTMDTEAQWVNDVGGTTMDYVKVKVTVNWSDSTTKAVSLTSLIAPR